MCPQVQMEKTPTGLLRYVLLRCVAWGFSTSGVERTFSRGGWCKGKRGEIPVCLANDEVLSCQFPENRVDEFLN